MGLTTPCALLPIACPLTQPIFCSMREPNPVPFFSNEPKSLSTFSAGSASTCPGAGLRGGGGGGKDGPKGVGAAIPVLTKDTGFAASGRLSPLPRPRLLLPPPPRSSSSDSSPKTPSMASSRLRLPPKRGRAPSSSSSSEDIGWCGVPFPPPSRATVLARYSTTPHHTGYDGYTSQRRRGLPRPDLYG